MKSLAVCLFAVGAHAVQKESTITKVVNVLKEMLDKSKVDGDAEAENFAKFKCYCDDNTMLLNNRIDEANKNINVLSNQIEQLQGSNGGASSKCAQLKTDMAANEAARVTQENLRKSDNEAFVAEETDLVAAIDQMDAAIQTLSEVGADQTLATGADHEQIMRGKSLAQTASSLKMKQAMEIVTRFLGEPTAAAQAAFLQRNAHTSPFTGTYTSQSGQIVGTLKNMRDTFEQNLETARRKEAQQLDAHNKFMKVKKDEWAEMDQEYKNQQGTLGGNDGNLATAKTSLATNKQQLSDDTTELSDLTSLCEEKTDQYEKRKSLRAQEDAAIAEAISILDSDAAFAAFSKQDSTSTGAHVAPEPEFLQLRSRRIRVHAQDHLKAEVRNALLKSGSPRVMKIASLLQAENVFETVLKEIANMKIVIAEERKADNDNLNWCNGERTDYDGRVEASNSKITNLNTDISNLDEKINHPETGLLVSISTSETALEDCRTRMKDQTEFRTKENLAYQQNIKDNVAAQKILTKAIAALKKYYENMDVEGTAFVQKGDIVTGATTSGDAAFSENYSGQSGKGNEVIGMLNFIQEETVKEEMAAHAAEETSQHEYEDAMAGEKKVEADTEDDLATFKQDLATAEEDLSNKQKELKDEEELLADAEAYLLKIKPGCDFITTNIEEREENRKTEETALTTADEKIRGTPVYKAYMAEAHSESFGDCREICDDDEEHVECKACMAKTTIPGYCAGHAGTKGC